MIKKVALAAALLGILLYSITSSFESESANYTRQLRQFRNDKNRAFRQSAQSPLSPAQKAQFDSLQYFPVGSYWSKANGELKRNAHPDTVELPLSDGQTEKYLRFGIVEFYEADPAPGQFPYKLTLFQKADGKDSTLFVPFTDRTNGHDTYGGGRYLDVPLPAPDATRITLDFNRAYNPYCAYNADYSCPQPPAENRLPISITAGEKSFHN